MSDATKEPVTPEAPLLTIDDLKVSFAQHGEDVVLSRLFTGNDGFYVDIGANDPVTDSVTKYFSLRGWSGINVEPLPELHARLRRDRARDVNIAAAISDASGTLELEEVIDAHGLSTATPELAAAARRDGRKTAKRAVRCLTLCELLDEHSRGRTIDFLKIDVEGHERAVIAGGDWKRHRPRMVLLESGWEPQQWHGVMRGFGYLDVLDDGLNRYYLREEEDRTLHALFKHPANVTDRFIRADHARAVLAAREWERMGPVLQNVTRRLAQVKDASPTMKSWLKALLQLS